MQHLLHQKKAEQFYTDLVLNQQYQVLQKLVELKDFSMLLSDFPVLFKTYLIFKDFSGKPSKFKYFPSLCEPCYHSHRMTNSIDKSSGYFRYYVTSCCHGDEAGTKKKYE